MFDLFKGRFNFSDVSRVVHKLPGRVRIHFRALERLSSRWHRYSAPVAELVKIKQGIQNTNIQPATGNVLITYDADTLAEKDIFELVGINGKNFPEQHSRFYVSVRR